MLEMRNCTAVRGFSSTLSFATIQRPEDSLASGQLLGTASTYALVPATDNGQLTTDNALSLQLPGKLREEIRHRIMFHQKFAKLLPLGDQEEQRLVDLPRREVDGPDQSFG